MAGTAVSSSMMALTVCTLLVSFSGYGMGQPDKKPLQFTYYLHDDFVPPGVTAVQTIALNGNFSGMSQFGDSSTFNSFLRTGASGNSTLIGYHSGTTSLLNEPSLFFINLVAELFHPSEYTGFFTMTGRFNSSKPSWELLINGGTGSFLGAKGYSTVTVANPDFQNGIVIRYDLNMYF